MKQIEITNDAEQDLIDIYLYGVEHFGLALALIARCAESAARLGFDPVALRAKSPFKPSGGTAAIPAA